MSALDRGKARDILRYARNLPRANEDYVLDRLEDCIAPELLDRQTTEESLVRQAQVFADRANAAQAKLARIAALCEAHAECTSDGRLARDVRAVLDGGAA